MKYLEILTACLFGLLFGAMFASGFLGTKLFWGLF